jgi:hypothetical protein
MISEIEYCSKSWYDIQFTLISDSRHIVLSSMSKCADITRNSEMRRNTYAAGLMYDLLSRNNFPNIYV